MLQMISQACLQDRCIVTMWTSDLDLRMMSLDVVRQVQLALRRMRTVRALVEYIQVLALDVSLDVGNRSSHHFAALSALVLPFS